MDVSEAKFFRKQIPFEIFTVDKKILKKELREIIYIFKKGKKISEFPKFMNFK